MRYRFHRLLGGPSPFLDRPVALAEVLARTGVRSVDLGWAPDLLRAVVEARPPAAAARVATMPPAPAYARGSGLGALIAWLAVELQRWGGHPVAFARSLGVQPGGQSEAIVYEARLAQIAAAAGQVAATLCDEAATTRSGRVGPAGGQALSRFLADLVHKTPGVGYIDAAEARGIPWRATIDGEAFLDLGHGHKQRRVWHSFTGATSHTASVLSTHKHFANALFRSHGLPVADQIVVQDEAGALAAARALGPPVVLKPASRDFGTSVHLGVTTEAQVRAAFADARRHGAVLVEKEIPGDPHRLMTIDGRFVSARLQKPAHVVGDGVRTVRALVDATNAARREKGWAPVPLDAESDFVLARHGRTRDDVPSVGVEVRLRTQGNLSQGGTMEIVTERVHPDNVRLALRAAAVVGIDIAGLDFITTDISRSYLDVGGAICEINVTPGFILDEERDVLAALFPGGDDGRIPTVVVLDGDDDVLERIAGVLAARGPVSRCGRGGVWLGVERIVAHDHANAVGARIALTEPLARSAVIGLRSDEFARTGAGFDRCDALVIPAGSAAMQAIEVLSRTTATVLPFSGWDEAFAAALGAAVGNGRR